MRNVGALAAVLLLTSIAFVPASAYSPEYELRLRYRDALADLRAGRTTSFREKQATLEDYALYPYLEYYASRRRLDELSAADVREFRDRYRDSPIAGRLYRAWLANLAKRGRWQSYRDAYEPSTSAEAQCNYRRSLFKTGDQEAALSATEVLWTVPRSQPKACDWLFETWIARGGLTQGTVWERMGLALEARQRSLARYLQRYLEGEARRLGELYYQVHRHPELVRERNRFKADTGMNRDIVSHGIRRLAMENPKAAAKVWAQYRKQLSFPAAEQRRIDDHVALRLAKAGVIPAHVDLTPGPRKREVTEAIALVAIENNDARAAAAMFAAMDEEQLASPRWRYWRARARWNDLSESPLRQAAEATLVELSRHRHYYGFLAANLIGTEPALNPRPTSPSPSVRMAMLKSPAVARIRELYAVDDIVNARREWHFLFPTLTADQRVTAAHMAAEMGWTDQSIKAAANAELYDDLDLRFPAPFRQLFLTESHASGVSVSFLYGITRQESAFEPGARSPAGAMGLMQLMPATATMTARSIGQGEVTSSQLEHPDINIRLGSRHLAELLARYDGNRVLAAAAYNAGRYRVDRWLKDRPLTPLDLWIENIPFAETRNYVMNVLAFSYIYSRKLGRTEPFLLANEQ